jgi:hypothetical protein
LASPLEFARVWFRGCEAATEPGLVEIGVVEPPPGDPPVVGPGSGSAWSRSGLQDCLLRVDAGPQLSQAWPRQELGSHQADVVG